MNFIASGMRAELTSAPVLRMMLAAQKESYPTPSRRTGGRRLWVSTDFYISGFRSITSYTFELFPGMFALADGFGADSRPGSAVFLMRGLCRRDAVLSTFGYDLRRPILEQKPDVVERRAQHS